MNKALPIAALVALLGLGGWYFSTPTQSTEVGSTQIELPMGAANAQEASVDTSGIVEMQLGNADAPVTIIEYASFTCPHCATFHATTFKELKKDYIDTGKVNFIYREVYFDRYGLWASMVARCGGEERFFGITDLIFKGLDTWARAGDPAAIADELRKIGRLAGIEDAALESCLSDGDKAQALVAWYEENAAADGIRSTPSLVIDGKLHSNMAYSELQSIIDDKLN